MKLVLSSEVASDDLECKLLFLVLECRVDTMLNLVANVSFYSIITFTDLLGHPYMDYITWGLAVIHVKTGIFCLSVVFKLWYHSRD